MSNMSIASLKYITGADLAARLRHTDPSHDDIAIIDVRGSDYIGGHIRGCMNVPSDTLDYAMPELVRTLSGKKTVVFHCALSQQRGPKAALEYLRAKNAVQSQGSDVPETTKSDKTQQEVYVLEGGFSKWQQR